MNNKVVMASAGSGKTTEIIRLASIDSNDKAAIITYTINGRDEILNKIYSTYGYVPPHISVDTWFSFLLRHFVRPYQRKLHETRVRSIHFVNARSDKFSKASDIRRHYFSGNDLMYSDKVSKFACELIRLTNGAPINRFSQIFGRLYVDECQDLAGYDLDLIEMLLKSPVTVTLVGDHRQATYSTNCGPKNSKYRGHNIVKKYEEWHQKKFCEIAYQNFSHRCSQLICSFADLFHPISVPTESFQSTITHHEGLFAILESQVPEYIKEFRPQSLRYSRRTTTFEKAINYGESKGMTFDRIIIYPHGPLAKFLKTGNLIDAGKELDKIYVAITRARYSVAFVVKDLNVIHQLQPYQGKFHDSI